MTLGGVTPRLLFLIQAGACSAGLSSCRKRDLRRDDRGPSRSAVLQEPGAHATALPSSTLLRPSVHGHTIGP